MSKNAVMPLDDYVSACDNIREKTETTEAIKSGELPKKINDVYEAGQKAEHDKMWDVFQKNGNRTDYPNTIGSFSGYAFTFDNFYPKYDIRPEGNANQLFYAWTLESGNVIGSLTQRLKDCGVVLDTSKATSLSNMFGYSCFTEIPTISFVSAISSSANNIRSIFANNPYLKTIEKIIVTENTYYQSWFNGDTNLKNVTFEGVIGQNGLNFSPCKNLTYDSCHSIFTHLKDFRQNIVDNYSIPTDTQGSPIAEYTLVAGQKYSGHYQNDAIGGCDFSGVAQYADVPIKGGRLAVTFELVDPMGTPYSVFVYNENGSLCIFDTSNVSLERYITISTITETRTITMPTTVRDNGNATPEDIAEATERGWSIVWA